MMQVIFSKIKRETLPFFDSNTEFYVIWTKNVLARAHKKF